MGRTNLWRVTCPGGCELTANVDVRALRSLHHQGERHQSPTPRVYHWLISLSLVNAPSLLSDNHFIASDVSDDDKPGRFQYGCGIYKNQGSDSLTARIVIPAILSPPKKFKRFVA